MLPPVAEGMFICVRVRVCVWVCALCEEAGALETDAVPLAVVIWSTVFKSAWFAERYAAPGETVWPFPEEAVFPIAEFPDCWVKA